MRYSPRHPKYISRLSAKRIDEAVSPPFPQCRANTQQFAQTMPTDMLTICSPSPTPSYGTAPELYGNILLQFSQQTTDTSPSWTVIQWMHCSLAPPRCLQHPAYKRVPCVLLAASNSLPTDSGCVPGQASRERTEIFCPTDR
jgi:hypothetical protein